MKDVVSLDKFKPFEGRKGDGREVRLLGLEVMEKLFELKLGIWGVALLLNLSNDLSQFVFINRLE